MLLLLLFDVIIIISNSIMFTISAGSNPGSEALMESHGLHSIHRTFRRMWLAPTRAIFWSCVILIFPGILSMCFSMPLLDYSKCPEDNRYCYCFQPPRFRNLNFQIFILGQFLCNFYWCVSVGGDCHIYQQACLFLLIFNNDVRFISFDRCVLAYPREW